MTQFKKTDGSTVDIPTTSEDDDILVEVPPPVQEAAGDAASGLAASNMAEARAAINEATQRRTTGGPAPAAASPAETFPIRIVMTGVDPSDLTWRERKAYESALRALGAETPEPNENGEITEEMFAGMFTLTDATMATVYVAYVRGGGKMSADEFADLRPAQYEIIGEPEPAGNA